MTTLSDHQAAMEAADAHFMRRFEDASLLPPMREAFREVARGYLYAYLSALPVKAEEWWPIDQGNPKSGDEILAYSETAGTGVMLIRWIAMCDFLTDTEIAEYADQSADKAMLYEPDWFYSDFIQGGRVSPDCYPTHFMEIPEVPEGAVP